VCSFPPLRSFKGAAFFYNSVTVALFEFFLSLLRTDEFLTWRRDRKKVAALLSWLFERR
jgi:hypothetical protein